MLQLYISPGRATPAKEYRLTPDAVNAVQNSLDEKGSALTQQDVSEAAILADIHTTGMVKNSYRTALVFETNTYQVALIGVIKDAPDIDGATSIAQIPPEVKVTFTDIHTRKKGRASQKMVKNTRLIVPGEYGQDKKIDTATIAAVDILQQDDMYREGDIITDCNITSATPVSTENLSIASWLYGIISSRIQHKENQLLTPSTGYNSDVSQLVALKVNNRQSLPTSDVLTSVLETIGDGLTGLIPTEVPISDIATLDRIDVINTRGLDDPNGVVNLGTLERMNDDWFLNPAQNTQALYAEMALRVSDTIEHMVNWFGIASIEGVMSNVDKSSDAVSLYDTVIRFANAPGSQQRLASVANSVPNYIKAHLPYISQDMDVSIWFNKRGTSIDITVAILDFGKKSYTYGFDTSAPGAMGITTTAGTSALTHAHAHQIIGGVDNLYSQL